MTTIPNHSALAKAAPLRRVPPDEAGHFFFGYYDKSPWDPSGRWMLAGRAEFMDRPPAPEDELQLGMIDWEGDGEFRSLASTTAWNWQQGCMLRWLDREHVIFNEREGDRFQSVIQHIRTGQRRVLPRPVYAVHPGRGLALSMNFARLHHLRPGYGYAGGGDAMLEQDAPEEDGLFVMDLRTGESRLVLSIAQAARLLAEQPPSQASHWLNHAEFAPGGYRVSVLHRWQTPGQEKPWATRLLTLNPDGTDLHPLIDEGVCSHYDWRDDEHLLAFARHGGGDPRFHLYTDRTHHARPVAPDRLARDGHCSYSPDRRWILNDTYPDSSDQHRTLMLISAADERVYSLGRYHGPNPGDKAARCDLHPRWHPQGGHVCFDSIHEGRRAMYVMDVRPVIGESP